MARGWESKSVADQIEATDVRVQDEPRPSDLSPEALARFERVESLKLSRARTLDQLERAANSLYRETLVRALASIENELEELLSNSSISKN